VNKWISDMPNADYHSRADINASLLKTIANKSLQAAKHERDHPPEQTAAMAFGSLAHSVILEPERVEANYAIAPAIDRRTKAGKTAWAEFQSANDGRIIVAQSDYETAVNMRDSVLSHPIAGSLLSGGEAELTGLFTDRETDRACRIRCDYIRRADNLIIDLKTTQSANRRQFANDFFKLGYDAQCAFYCDGAEAIDGNPFDFIFLAIEKAAPFLVGIYTPSIETIEHGRKAYRAALRQWIEAEKTGAYPGYNADRVTPIELPTWKKEAA
jgi:hypothetical protein